MQSPRCVLRALAVGLCAAAASAQVTVGASLTIACGANLDTTSLFVVVQHPDMQPSCSCHAGDGFGALRIPAVSGCVSNACNALGQNFETPMLALEFATTIGTTTYRATGSIPGAGSSGPGELRAAPLANYFPSGPIDIFCTCHCDNSTILCATLWIC